MKRHQIYIVSSFFLVSFWFLLKFTNKFPMSDDFKFVVDVVPWLILMWFGCFCLAKLGFDLICFNDFPQEILVLEKVTQCNLFDFFLKFIA